MSVTLDNNESPGTVSGTEQASSEAADDPSREVPGLSRIIRLIEQSLVARDALTITSQVVAGIKPIILETRASLPSWLQDASAEGYRRIELHHCPVSGYQILAMVWGPGQGTRIHDHGETWGVEAVWQGRLQVGEFSLVETRDSLFRLSPLGSADLEAGDIATVSPEQQLHLCRNPSRRDVTISLHIYGKPLDTCMEFIGVEKDWYERRETALRYD